MKKVWTAISLKPALKQALGASVLAAAACAAQAADVPKFYIGGLTGLTLVGARDYDVQDDNDRDASVRPSYGLFAGLQFASIPIGRGWPVGVEAGYVNFNRSTIWYETPNGDTPVTAKGRAAYLAARLDARVVKGLSIYGKLGASANKVKSSVPSSYATRIDLNGDKTGVLAALGIQYTFDFGLGLGGEFTSFGRASPGSDAAGFSLRASYYF